MSELAMLKKRVSYYETDAMGIVHHSNYLRYFEDARLSWLEKRGLLGFHSPQADLSLAVVESGCQHFKPAYFGDWLSVFLQVRCHGLKIFIQYAITSDRFDRIIASGTTTHVPVNGNLKVCRLPKEFGRALEKEKWTETWP